MYTIIIVLISKLSKKTKELKSNSSLKSQELPTVSFIVAAYNEESVIEDKIRNFFEIDYPKDKIELIVISDGSTDSTHKKAVSNSQIIALHQAPRAGKTAALNRAVTFAKGEFLVFSDANSMFRPDAVLKLIRHFSNASIGGVCGRKSVINDPTRAAGGGDSLFWHYESFLKSKESDLGSIPTADGEIFALRKSLYSPVNEEIINDDMAITFSILNKGLRVIYDKEAITEEEASITHQDDFKVKARMVYGGLQIMAQYKSLLNPFKSFYALRFFIHKTLRYFMWLLLLFIFISNISLIGNSTFYLFFFLVQCLFYSMALTGYLSDKLQFNRNFFYYPYYYCNVNAAAFKGFIFFLKKSSGVSVWTKAQRK